MGVLHGVWVSASLVMRIAFLFVFTCLSKALILLIASWFNTTSLPLEVAPYLTRETLTPTRNP